MKQEQITLRCEDGAEVVVFTKYIYNPIVANNIDYEITIEDSYIGGDYKGFFGRIKRAWRAFWDKPVIYTGIYCEDKDKMRKFLCDCLNLMEDEVSATFPKLQLNDFIEVYGNKEMRFFLSDEYAQIDGIVYPDEDYEFKEKDITEVWRQVDNDTFKCIYKKMDSNHTTNEEPFLKGLYNEDGSVTTNEELIKKGEW